ncbi:hypothetical protein C8F04DRAFT_1393768 [Mycena alexandri]|uniref:Uncharacterized protein n=1 Tax=Mycena alexandri TaxID=1745969 RepID=A0AAD6X6G2_9AGAR|nr:hypothetical protein C8F04DRAFT_1393768 [Mycena alexandri]
MSGMSKSETQIQLKEIQWTVLLRHTAHTHLDHVSANRFFRTTWWKPPTHVVRFAFVYTSNDTAPFEIISYRCSHTQHLFGAGNRPVFRLVNLPTISASLHTPLAGRVLKRGVHRTDRGILPWIHHSGSHLESLSLSYRVDGAIPTQSFEYRVLGLTPRLKTLSLTGQYPETVPTTLRTPMSASLTRLTIGMRYSSPMDWPLVDALLATQHYAALEHVAFTEGISKRNTITPETKALMPRGTARNLFVSQSADEHGLPRAPLGALVFATRHSGSRRGQIGGSQFAVPRTPSSYVS